MFQTPSIGGGCHDAVRARAALFRLSLCGWLLLCSVSCSRAPSESGASSTTLTAEGEKALRAALSADRLGVDADARIELWLDRLQERVRSRPPPTLFSWADKADAVEQADEVLAKGWVLRGHEPVRLNAPLPWDRVPDGDDNWHYALNALHPLNDVLEAYVRTGRDVYVDAALAVMLDWIDFNITRNKSNTRKWHDMSTGYRAEKLAFITQHASRTGKLGPGELALLLTAAVEHARVLTNPKLLPKTNHAVFMLLGLAAICRTLPELSQCDARGAYAAQTLERVLGKQFAEGEGIHLEGAPGYHLFMANTLAGLHRTGLFDNSPRLLALAEAALREVPRMFHPNGDAVLIGDSEAMRLDAFAMHSAEARFVVSEGREGVAPLPEDVAFTRAGYAILRSPWTQKPFSGHSFLFFSAAWHAAGHNHADHFTFEWSERGFPIVVDSGKFTYDKGLEREFFSGTRAGNALEIDGRALRRVSKASSLRGFGRADPLRFVEAVVRRPEKVTHTRLLVLRMGEWLCIVDRLESSSEHEYRQWFGLHEEASAVLEPASKALRVELPRGGPSVVAQSHGPSGAIEPELVKGQTGARMQGWLSREYKKMVPRYSVGFAERGKSVDLITLLSLDTAVDEWVARQVEGRLEVSFRRKGAREGFEYQVEGQRGHVTPL